MATARLALVLGLVSVLVAPAAGAAYRMGVVPLAAALLPAMGGAALLGAGAVVAAVVALARAAPRGVHGTTTALAVTGLLLGLVAVGLPASWMLRARGVPVIHDITTDVRNPPVFDAVVPLRADAPNGLDYDPNVGELQRRAYPDIVPLVLQTGRDAAFQRALAAARDAGWAIVASDPRAGRIEATDTTFWFGFKDDVVVRLTEEDAGTRVDVRSVSRVGRGDVGTNARRIRAYLAALRASA
jgi:uncharacterized protein (DUF1499 family)